MRDSRNGSARDAGIRVARLERLFLEELNYLLENEIQCPALQGVRATSVQLSSDGARARVWVSFPPSSAPKSAMDELVRAGGFLRYRLCEVLPLKRTPELKLCRVPGLPSSAPSEDETNGD
ncbi:MAG TPA: ribosome-binding factor A [Polyangiaceae bacterium]